MKLTSTILALSLLVLAAQEASPSGKSQSVSFKPGARFEYFLQAEKTYSPDLWNFSSSTRANRSRLMLDLRVISSSYGKAYIKGDALFDASRSKDGDERFVFRQGDYMWTAGGEENRCSLSLFANERRFFSGEYLAPLLYDDYVEGAGENRGLRFEGVLWKKLSVQSLWASLGNNWENTRKISFVKSAYMHSEFHMSLSYLNDIPPQEGALNHAVVKGELAWFYKHAAFLFSYEQSGYSSSMLFFPRAGFSFDKFVGDNFSAVLPQAGAFFAEARIADIPLREVGEISIVHSYFAMGPDFVNDLGQKGGATVGYLLGAYFRAREVDLNARLQIEKSVRSRLEGEKLERIGASVNGGLKDGIDFNLRGAWTETSGNTIDASKRNWILGGVNYYTKKMRSGFHAMLKDIDAAHSDGSLAWDSRIVLNSDFAVDLRFILSKAVIVEDTVFGRLEFRPTQHLYAYFSYGRDYLGNGPFLLEDRDLNLSNVNASIYTVSLRGDF